MRKSTGICLLCCLFLETVDSQTTAHGGTASTVENKFVDKLSRNDNFIKKKYQSSSNCQKFRVELQRAIDKTKAFARPR